MTRARWGSVWRAGTRAISQVSVGEKPMPLAERLRALVYAFIRALAIVALCVVASAVYGVAHDQITVRVCMEYFTIGHAPVFATRDPTLLALAWGVYATWWAGLLIGVPIAYAAQRGRKPRRDARALVKPVAVLLGVMAATALVAGIVGASLASFGAVVLTGDLGSAVPKAAHTAYLACLWTHTASYAVGFLGGGIVLPVWIWHQRGRRVIA
jgi:hypothetical protein